MISFLGRTPVLTVRLENLVLRKGYPLEGFVEGVVDTGYDGFVAIPREAFDSLSLGELQTSARKLKGPSGSVIDASGSLATIRISGIDRDLDGTIETFPGLGEVLIGTRLLSRFKLTLDYCLQAAAIEPCTG